jgi:hypothetical protein
MRSLRDGLRPLTDSVGTPPDIHELAAAKASRRPRVALTVGVVAAAVAVLVVGLVATRPHARHVVAFGPVGPRVTAPADDSSIGSATSYACRADGLTVVTWTLTNHGAPTSIGAASTVISGRRFRLRFSPQVMATGETSTASLVTANPITDTTIFVRTGDVSGNIGGKDRPTKPCTPGPSTTTPTTAARCPAAGPTVCKRSAPSSILPPASSPPEVTVNLYLAALNSHNTALAEQLLEPARRAAVEQGVDSMLTNVVSLTDIRITHVTMLPIGPGSPPSNRDGVPAGYTQAAVVSVTFNLHQKHQISMTDGPTVWGYTVVRRNSASRWLIAAEGVG